MQVVEQNPTDLILVMADMARANPPLSGAFLAEMTRHLQGQSPHFAFANSWLEHRLSEQGLTIEQLVLAEGQAQAADQVSMGNSITSLRFLSSNDWREFVENHSLVEQILREDPAASTPAWTSPPATATATSWRRLPSGASCSEHDVARKAIQLAGQEPAARVGEGSGRSHGPRRLLPDRPGPPCPGAQRRDAAVPADRGGQDRSVAIHCSFICAACLLITAVVTAAFLAWSIGWDAERIALCLLAIPACDVRGPPGRRDRQLAGDPAGEAASAAPAGFQRRHPAGAPHDGRRADDALEPRGRGGSAGRARSAVPGQPRRQPPFRPVDRFRGCAAGGHAGGRGTGAAGAGRHRAAQPEVRGSSDRHLLTSSTARGAGTRRKACGWVTSASAASWRSSTRFLRGEPGGSRSPQIVGDTTVLPEVRYVITLDTDTQLPRDSAREMVGAMAHPLNRPVFDPERRRVVEGYGILQPRVGVSLPSARRSWFVRLFAGDAGVDPYTRVVSDVYQDLFGEGSFVGKGIYDVDAFEQSCGGFPENAILSHDLLESAYARSALLSDVELYEEFPSRYPPTSAGGIAGCAATGRSPGGCCPGSRAPAVRTGQEPDLARCRGGRSSTTSAAAWCRWRCWCCCWSPGCWWGRRWAATATLFVLAVVGAVPLLAVLARPGSQAGRPAAADAPARDGQRAGQTSGPVPVHARLPPVRRVHQPRCDRANAGAGALDEKETAGVEDLQRRRARRRHRPAWLLPVHVGRAGDCRRGDLAPDPVPTRPAAGRRAAARAVARLAGRRLVAEPPLAAPPVRLSDAAAVFLGKLSRRTWRYFEVFVTAEENWLPPDNFQEHPARAVASRTSPTNIGMALLADLAAYDFGYCSAGRLLDRTQKTFGTLARMERYRGHFYNWYDTRSLKPLPPLYVSTVDSGNLAGNLLVLRSGLLELVETQSAAAAHLRRAARHGARAAGRGPRASPDGRGGPHPAGSRRVLRKIERLEETWRIDRTR